jgi:DNA invertase Pin-like site-specific DNA recombinase
LERAIAKCREHGAILLAESVDRFLRPVAYNPKTDPDEWPTVEDFASLGELAGEVPLATMLHPDTDWKAVRGHQIWRGQQAKGKRGGRPASNPPGYKKEWRLKFKPLVLELKDAGDSLSEIESKTGVSRSTSSRWINAR